MAGRTVKRSCVAWDMSKQRQRVHEVPAYILHTIDWRETSLIAHLFTESHGRVTVVAKGAKRPYSRLKAVLLSFQAVEVGWVGSGEIKTLTTAELARIHPLPGSALLSAWYVNELLLLMLPKEDPHPQLFAAYSETLEALTRAPAYLAPILRRFEWLLLQETGYGLEGSMPSLEEFRTDPALRQLLRERLNELLSRPLRTRQVLQELHHL